MSAVPCSLVRSLFAPCLCLLWGCGQVAVAGGSGGGVGSGGVGSGGAGSGGADAPSGGAGTGGSGDDTGCDAAEIQDAGLQSAIKDQLGLDESAPLDPARFGDITSLFASGVAELEGLSCLSSLTGLTLTESPLLVDLGPLEGVPQLTSLQLTEVGADDFTAVSRLRKLRAVGILASPLSSLDPLAALPSLELLSVVRVPVSDLAPLVGSDSLLTVTASHTQVTTLEPLLAWEHPPLTLTVTDSPLDDAVFEEQIPALVEQGFCVVTGVEGTTVEHPLDCVPPDKP